MEKCVKLPKKFKLFAKTKYNDVFELKDIEFKLDGSLMNVGISTEHQDADDDCTTYIVEAEDIEDIYMNVIDDGTERKRSEILKAVDN